MRNTGDHHSATRYKKGQWTPEEDLLLMKYIETHGEGKWRTLPQKAGLKRCGKGCRLRWKNYLHPNVKRGNISLEEEDLIIRLHKLVGNRWSLIAGRVPGRTDNEIKNYWNSHLSKKLHRNVTLENGILHEHNHSSLPDCRIDCLESQQQEYHTESQITDNQLDQSSHMACASHQPPHFEVEDSSTRFSRYLSANHDVGLSTGAWLQQPLPPSAHFYERNGHVFHSMVATQPKYCSNSLLCADGFYDKIRDQNDLGSDRPDHYEEMWDYSHLRCTEIAESPPQLASDYELLSKIFEDSVTNAFGADVQKDEFHIRQSQYL